MKPGNQANQGNWAIFHETQGKHGNNFAKLWEISWNLEIEIEFFSFTLFSQGSHPS